MKYFNKHLYTILAATLLFSCTPKTSEQLSTEEAKEPFNFYQTQFFKDVQLSGVYPDSKTFVDCTPKASLEEIVNNYNEEKEAEGFQIIDFVNQYFELPETPVTGYETDTSESMQQHVVGLWKVLTRQPESQAKNTSLIPLPNPYIVPGGRFREIYYWDSYFTMEGLMLSGQMNMAKNMVDNFSFLIDSIGFIPNGNRDYYRGRSQPPFYALMVDLVASDNRDLFVSYLPFLEKEYNFWMDGKESLSSENPEHRRVVMLDDSVILNRYWDNYALPRPESYREDYKLVEENNLDSVTTYRHLRAGAESGWDYSSRWLRDKQTLSTIHTTDIIPIDLNTLLYFLELKIAQGYNWEGDLEKAQFYLDQAQKRKEAIDTYLWDAASGFYVDYDFKAKQPTGVLSLAAAYPLFFKIATKPQAKSVSERLINEFLQPGGFVTTLNKTGQQWDSPNGWAPLQWISINGLYNYGYSDEGNDAAERWLTRNREVYKATGKMMEKYNVMDLALLAGGGEYPLQDGFGWTNGVDIALSKILEDKKVVEEMVEHQD